MTQKIYLAGLNHPGVARTVTPPVGFPVLTTIELGTDHSGAFILLTWAAE